MILHTRWGSIRVSLRPYGPEMNNEFCTIVICADSPAFRLHPLGAPYMSEGLQSISFRAIQSSSDGTGPTTSAEDGPHLIQSTTTFSRGSNFEQDG